MPFSGCRRRLFARRGFVLGGGRGVGGFRFDCALRLRLSIRNGRRLRRRGNPVLRRIFMFAGGCRARILVSVVAAQLEDHVVLKRTGVRLFVGDAEFGEPLQYFVSFNFQLPRQLVNSDLSHR